MPGETIIKWPVGWRPYFGVKEFGRETDPGYAWPIHPPVAGPLEGPGPRKEI